MTDLVQLTGGRGPSEQRRISLISPRVRWPRQVGEILIGPRHGVNLLRGVSIRVRLGD